MVKSAQPYAASLLKDDWVRFESPDMPWTVDLWVAKVDGVPRILGLRMKGREDVRVADRVITTKELGRLPLSRLSKAALQLQAFDLRALSRSLRQVERNPDGSWPEPHYHLVAQIYRAALERHRPPLPAIQQHWGHLSRAAAAKWVKRARELGLLGYPDRRGVAGTEQATSPVAKASRGKGKRP